MFDDVNGDQRERAARIISAFCDYSAAAEFFDIPKDFVSLAMRASYYCPGEIVKKILKSQLYLAA